MPPTRRPTLLWAPRILGLLFAAFLSLFALDVFGSGFSPLETMVALAMHLLPVWILLFTLVIAWRWPWIGGLGFIGFGLWYIASARGPTNSVYLIIAGPPILIGALFLAGWWATHRPPTTS